MIFEIVKFGKFLDFFFNFEFFPYFEKQNLIKKFENLGFVRLLDIPPIPIFALWNSKPHSQKY